MPGEWAWVLGVFRHLSADRQLGMGVGPIPFTAVDRYAERYNLGGDDFEDLLDLIGRLDAAYLSHVNAKGSGAGSEPAAGDRQPAG